MKPQDIIPYLTSKGLCNGGIVVDLAAVTPQKLISICDDFLAQQLGENDLTLIADAFMTGYSWDREDVDERVERVLLEWYAPEFMLEAEEIKQLRGHLNGEAWKPLSPWKWKPLRPPNIE